MKNLTPEIVKNKRVLMRVDFNVDVDEKGNVIDDFRIVKVLPTINFLLENQAKLIILLSHRGRPQEEKDFKKLSLEPIANHLEKLLRRKVYFIKDSLKQKGELNNLEKGSIVLLENLRFYPEEEKNDFGFAKKLSALGDIYINDAFSVSHRAEATLVSLPKLLPSYAGLLLRQEIEALDKIKNAIGDKLVIILGGAKIEDKLPLINVFIKQAKFILVGGALANTIIKSWDFEVGRSLIDVSMLLEAKELGSQKAELVIPGDYQVLTKEKRVATRGLGEVSKTDNILDIGPIAAKTFNKIIGKADTIFWSGPMGKIEDQRFRDGTIEIIKAIIDNNKAQIVIGGGDTIASLKIKNQKSKIKNNINIFLSTGGGAMMSYLAGKPMPGLIALN
jgi:phosphoglycerate kinase